MDSVLSFRKKLKSDGIDVSINDIIIKSVGIALSLCPDVNVVWKGDKVRKNSSSSSSDDDFLFKISSL